MVVMINHELRHPAVNADILPGNETGLGRAQEHYHVCDIHRVPDSPGWLLQGIRSVINMIRATLINNDIPS